jgi:hypothetical protein
VIAFADVPVSYLAMLAESSYSSAATWERADVHAARTIVRDVNVITFRGSKSLIDWWRDFQVFDGNSFDHPELGIVHGGILGDVLQVFDQIEQDVGDAPVVFNGHSKGGGEAQDAAALRLLRRRPVLGLWTYGAPHVGALKGVISALPGRDFRHAGDPVPTVSDVLGIPRTQTEIGARSDESIADELADHAISGYRRVIEAIG